MKIKLPKWIRFSCLLCLTSLVIILNNNYALKANESNSKVESCLPSVDNKHVFERQLLGVVNYEERQYYLVSLIINQGVAIFDNWSYEKESYMIVSLGHLGCGIHMATGQYHQSSLEKYVPQLVARQLALIKLKYEINQAGNLANFLQPPDVLEEHGSPWILFPEDVWAWQQLGISLPDNHRVVRDVSELGL